MKHFYLLLTAIFFSVLIHAQNAPFITTWEVTSGKLGITIPTSGSGYNYTVDFGDGTVQNNVTGNTTHTYSQPGVYTVSILGDFPRIYFNSGNVITSHSNSYKISSVEHWGDIQWQSMERAFRGCVNLVINATDIPDLSQVMNMSHMFDFNLSLNQPLDNWDVSSATDMSSMFLNANSFNQPLNNWDVSNVINMSGMFSGDGISFNQPLNNWDVSNVTNMSKMFSGAYVFNQPLNNWDVSNVTNMTWMFEAAFDFNQPLNNWNVSNVLSMDSMFQLAISFNQPINAWNVSNVTLMESMFRNAQSFNQDISNWQINTGDLSFFLSNSGLDRQNYDMFLTHLVTLNINNGKLGADGLKYCNSAARDHLINQLGWTINGDSLYSNCNLGLADNPNPLNKITVYPNPTNKTLHIHLTDGIELEKVLIYDLQGREVQKIQGNRATLNVEGLRTGIYLLKLQTNQGTINRQLIKN